MTCAPTRRRVRWSVVLRYIALAIVLVTGQQHALRHTLSHTFESSRQSHEVAPISVAQCVECLGLASIGSALGRSPTTLSHDRARYATPLTPVVTPRSVATTPAYQPRAPPELSIEYSDRKGRGAHRVLSSFV